MYMGEMSHDMSITTTITTTTTLPDVDRAALMDFGGHHIHHTLCAGGGLAARLLHNHRHGSGLGEMGLA